MLHDLIPYQYAIVGTRHSHSFTVPTFGDVQHVVLDLYAKITSADANGNVLDLIEYIELRGNGTEPLIRYYQDHNDLRDFHIMYCHCEPRNEAFVTTEATVGSVVLPIPTHRKRWQTLTLFVQFQAATTLDEDATVLELTVSPAIRYGPIPYSWRVKSKVLDGTDDIAFDAPTDQGLLHALVVEGTTNDNMDEFILRDRQNQYVVNTHYDRIRGEMQYYTEITDVAGAVLYCPVPITPCSKDVNVILDQAVTEDVRCYFLFNAGAVRLNALPSSEEYSRGQRPLASETYMESTKYEEQINEADGPMDEIGGSPLSPG